MLKKYNQIMIALFIIGDLGATYLSLVLAYLIRFHVQSFRASFEIQHVPPITDFVKWEYMISLGVIWLVVFHFNGLYHTKRGRSLIDEFFSIISSVILSLIILLGVIFFYRKPSYDISRSLIIIFFFLDIFLVGLSRSAIRSAFRLLRKKGFNLKKVLVVGAGALGRTFVKRVTRHPHLGFNIIGFVDDAEAKRGVTFDGIKVLGTIDQIDEIIEEYLPDQVYIALPHSAHRKIIELLSRVQKECVSLRLIPDVLDYMALKADIDDLDGLPIINITDIPLNGWNSMLKRLMDITLSLSGMIILSPLFLVVAILIKLTSKGPIFYSQERMGMDGKSFMIYKFRSMVYNAEEKTGPTFTRKNDPRTTRLGAVLRRYSIDELPQLLNVLKGDMSLVGPRPERPLFVEEFKTKIPRYMLRHKVKSGMTGWAQVHGLRGSGTSMEKRVEYDIYYIKNWSLKLDIIILLMTLIRYRDIHENAF